MTDWKEARLKQLARQRFLLQAKLKEIDTEVEKITEVQIPERGNLLIQKRTDNDGDVRDRPASG